MSRKVADIDLSDKEVRSFQEVFPKSPASQVMDRIFQKHMKFWSAESMLLGASEARLRQAQGAMATLMQMDADIAAILKVDLDKDEEPEAPIEEESDAGPDLF